MAERKYPYELTTYRCEKCGRVFELFKPKYHYPNNGTGLRCTGKLIKGKLVWIPDEI